MSGNQQIFQKAMSQGHTAAWEQNWHQAAIFYSQALKEFPDHPGTLNNLGLAYFELKQLDHALNAYRRASAVSPNDPIPLEKISQILEIQKKFVEASQIASHAAEIYAKAKDIEKAIENWGKAVRLQPENLTARTRLAIVFERTGRKTEAIRAYLSIARIMQKQENINKASQVVDYCLQIQPENLEAQNARRFLQNNQLIPQIEYLQKSEPGKLTLSASEATDQAVQTGDSDDPIMETSQKAWTEIASLVFNDKEEEQSADPASKHTLSKGQTGRLLKPKDKNQIPMYLNLAIEAHSKGDYETSARELEKAVVSGLDHPAIQYELGRYYFSINQKKSIRSLQSSAHHSDYALASFLLLAQLFENADDQKQSASAFLNALRYADIQTSLPKNENELFELYDSVIESKLGDQSTKSELKKIGQNISKHLLRKDWRSHLQQAKREFLPPGGSIPIPLSEVLLSSGSNQLIDLILDVRLLANQHKYRSAIDEAFKGIEQSPFYLPLHVQIADLLLLDGKTHAAITKYKLVARLYTIQGEIPQAIQLLKRVIKLIPMDTTLQEQIIELLLSQGKYQEAIQHFLMLASTYTQLADFEKARKTYNTALSFTKQFPDEKKSSIDILNKIADLDIQHLDWRQAIRLFEQIRTLDPEDTKARTQIIVLNYRLGQENSAFTEVDGFIHLLENSGKIQECIHFLEGLIKELPEKLDLRKRLADFYIRNGKVPQAVEQLDVLADAILASGNKPGAISMLQAIIALNPPNIQEYRNALLKIQQQKQA